jgi:hypothetical protein
VVADLAARFGASAIVGGLTWERRVVDPVPGPRHLDELRNAQPLNAAVAWANADTTGPGDFHFAESRLAGLLGERVLLVDPWPGPRGVAEALDDAAGQLDADLIALVDVGGDVLAEGHEPGLGSPLADSLLLAAGAHLQTPVVGAVWGAACDGELPLDEVLGRIAELAAAEALIGAWGTPPDLLPRLEEAIAAVPTEASAMATACARGSYGTAHIRNGARSVPLSPVGALTFVFDVRRALDSRAAPMAALMQDAGSLEAAEALLQGQGIHSELAYEREHYRP